MEAMVAGKAMLMAEAHSSSHLAAAGIEVNQDGRRRTGYELLSHADVTEAQILRLVPAYAGMPAEIRAQIGREALYANYIDRQERDVAALRRDEAVAVPADFDFARLAGLSVGGATVVAFLTVCAAAYDQPFYLDLALVLVLLGMVGQVAFAHFLEKWL